MKPSLSTENDIPANERWLHATRAAAELQSALIWAIETKPSENSLSDIEDDNELASLLLKVKAVGSQCVRAWDDPTMRLKRRL